MSAVFAVVAAFVILAYALMVLNGMGRQSCWVTRGAHILLAVGAFAGMVWHVGIGGARLLQWSNTLLLVGIAALIFALGLRRRRIS